MTRIILMVSFVLLVGAGLFLFTWDIPPPSSEIEVVIPDDRLPK